MKKLITILLIMLFAFTSCKKDDNPVSSDSASNSSVTSISGTIPNYTLGAGKSIKLSYWGNGYSDYPTYGSAVVDANGNFNITSLSNVPDDQLNDQSEIPSGVVSSDLSAKIHGGFALRIYTTSTTIPTHTVDKGIFHSTTRAGDYYVNFIYSNKDFSIQGTHIESGEEYRWNVSLKKGWNKMIELVKQASPLIMEYSNDEPDGGYWYLYQM